MKEPVWVLPEIVIAVHHMLIAEHGGLHGMRDETLLDSALNRPRHLFSYNMKVSLFDLAASYCYGMSKNHPFVDGNKRVSLTIAAVFLELNGYSLTAPEPEAVIMIERLAAGKLVEEDLSRWFRDSSVRIA